MSVGQDSIGHDLTGHHGSHDELAPPRVDGIPAAGLIATPKRTERPPWEERLLAAATPMRVHAASPAASWGVGRTVLLVHGWQGRGTQLGGFVEPIVATGRRVVAVDAPGHGDSPVGWFTPVAFGEALLRVQEAAGDLDGVVVHSMGAAAVMVALRSGLRTASLTLIAPLPSFTDAVRRVGASCGFEPGTLAGEYYLRLSGEVLGRPVADLDLDPAAMGDAAVMLCHDRTDQTIPVTSTRQLAEAWPHAAYIETTGLGHEDILTDPAVVSAVVSHITAVRHA